MHEARTFLSRCARLSALLCLAAGVTAGAHEPFDVSSRITISGDRLELVSTLGREGMKQLLSASARSPDQIEESLKSLGPGAPAEYPVTLAPLFVKMKSRGEPLLPDRVISVSEGAEILFTVSFPRPAPGALEVRMTCYETIPGLHHGVLSISDEGAGELGTAMLSPARPHLSVTVPAASPTAGTGVDWNASESPRAAPAFSPPHPSSAEFFHLGVHHILTGLDHLLFLAALLLGIRRPGAMLAIVTCFTLAHSVTLALAAFEVVSVSPRIIEPLIAASIGVVCVTNVLRKDAETDRVWIAAGFGLIHGFGFASALRATGLGQGPAIVMPLLSFNLGVEAGQLAVAAMFLPLLLWLRRWKGFVRYGMPSLSLGVIFISGYWLVERIFF